MQEILALSDTSLQESSAGRQKPSISMKLLWGYETGGHNNREARTQNSNKSQWDHIVCVVPPKEHCANSSHSEANRALEHACILDGSNRCFF